VGEARFPRLTDDSGTAYELTVPAGELREGHATIEFEPAPPPASSSLHPGQPGWGLAHRASLVREATERAVARRRNTLFRPLNSNATRRVLAYLKAKERHR
jgi:hypothetical protein